MMRLRLLPILAFLGLCLPALPARAQDEEVRTVRFDGPEVFAHVLFSEGIKPITSIEEAARNPGNSTIIVFGNPTVLPKVQKAIGGLLGYRAKGGNLFIATDQRADMMDYSLSIRGTQVAQLNPDQAYRRTPDCPWVTYPEPNGQGVEDPAAHPLLRGLHRGIATNCPSYLFVLMKQLPKKRSVTVPLLKISTPFMPVKGKMLDSCDYAAASPNDTPPRGRVLLVAGHGMFMNAMMLQDDNDNLAFARNAVRWLQEDDIGKRTRRALFIYDGRIITDFDMNLTGTPPPLPMPTAQMLNRLIRGLEEERFFHRLVAELLGRQLEIIVLALLGIVTLAALSYGAKKAFAARAHLETAAPSMVGLASSTDSADEQRQQALWQKTDFREQAHQLAVEWFRTEFGVSPEKWRPGVQAAFQAAGSFLARWRLQSKAKDALRLARAADPGTVSRRQFFRLAQTLKELAEARQTGRLALLVDGEIVRQS
jgi:hypothetical protein